MAASNTGGYALRRLNAFSARPRSTPCDSGRAARGTKLATAVRRDVATKIEVNRGFNATYQDGGAGGLAGDSRRQPGTDGTVDGDLLGGVGISGIRGACPAMRGGIPLGFGQVMNTNVQLLDRTFYGIRLFRSSHPDRSRTGVSSSAVLALGEHWRATNNLHLAFRWICSRARRNHRRVGDLRGALQRLGAPRGRPRATRGYGRGQDPRDTLGRAAERDTRLHAGPRIRLGKSCSFR